MFTKNDGVAEMIDQQAFLDINAEFFDETKCREWLLKNLHQSGVHCPGCGSAQVDPGRIKNFYNGDRLSCRICGKYFTALTATPFSGTHFDFRSLFLLAFFVGCGIQNKIIAEKLDITLQSAQTWQKKIKSMPLFSG